MSHLSTLLLHRLRYDELDNEQTSVARAHLAVCPDCVDRLQAQERHRQAFAHTPLPAAIGVQPARRPSWVWAPVIALAAAVLLMVQPPEPDIRTKGTAEVVLHLEGSGPIASGQFLTSGDRLRVSVPPGAWKYAWVSDGKRVLGSFETSPQSPTISPFSIELDDEDNEEENLFIILAPNSLSDDQLEKIVAGHRMNGVSVTSIALPRVR